MDGVVRAKQKVKVEKTLIGVTLFVVRAKIYRMPGNFSLPEWHLLKPIRVASGGNVGGREAAVEPTRTYSRRFPEEVTRVGGSIARR